MNRMRFVLDLRMFRPEVADFVETGGLVEGWQPLAPCLYHNDFETQNAAADFDAGFKQAVDEAFSDHPFYLFYPSEP